LLRASVSIRGEFREEGTMATVKHISPLSALKVGAVVYAVFGLIVGACMALFSMLAGSLAGLAGSAAPGARALGFGFGAGAIIVVPILYGIIGAIGGAIGAALYNLAAGWVGGLEVDIS
jgi:hypothetical protein